MKPHYCPYAHKISIACYLHNEQTEKHVAKFCLVHDMQTMRDERSALRTGKLDEE
jgi:hypothetical protein